LHLEVPYVNSSKASRFIPQNVKYAYSRQIPDLACKLNAFVFSVMPSNDTQVVTAKIKEMLLKFFTNINRKRIPAGDQFVFLQLALTENDRWVRLHLMRLPAQ